MILGRMYSIIKMVNSMKNKPHNIIYINDDGTKREKKKFQHVIFIGENEILKKIRIRKVVFPIVLCTLLFSVCYTGYGIYAWGQDGEETKKVTEDYISLGEVTEEESVKEENIVESIKPAEPADKDNKNEETNSPTINNSYYWKFNNVKMLNVNFDKLSKVNNETVAWLKVPGTKINYPVVHHNDNDFYLNHTFDKSENSVGWVFLDQRNNGYLTNRNNVIYAHGRLDNVMFGTLKNVLKKSWYTDESNRIIKTSTPTHNDLWEVFSVYTIKAESYYIRTGFESNLDFYNFITTITDRSIYDFGVTVSFTDKILTLSTCYNDETRIVLHARLIVQDNKIESEYIPNENINTNEGLDTPTPPTENNMQGSENATTESNKEESNVSDNNIESNDATNSNLDTNINNETNNLIEQNS